MTANTPVGQCRQFMRACNLLIEFWVRKMEQHLIDAIYYNIWMFICQHQTENNTEKSKLLNSNRLKNSLLHFYFIPLVSSAKTMGGRRSGSSSSPACSPVARSRFRSRKSGTSMATSAERQRDIKV